jgi:hypothetical protein
VRPSFSEPDSMKIETFDPSMVKAAYDLRNGSFSLFGREWFLTSIETDSYYGEGFFGMITARAVMIGAEQPKSGLWAWAA